MYSIGLQTILYKYQNKNHKIDGFKPIIFHFDIRGKLSIIRCDKYILSKSRLSAVSIKLSPDHKRISFLYKNVIVDADSLG